MACIDSSTNQVWVRIVYSGAPFSGKTASLHALARELTPGRECAVYSPEDVDGRTLFFDWFEYEGGSFRGVPIKCQVLTVPGQDELCERRQKILSDADAVVFVVDANQEQVPSAGTFARELQGLRESEQPVPLVVQANKQDLGAATSPADVLRTLGCTPDTRYMPASAVNTEGVRAVFVTAVGLALERTRALAAAGNLTEVVSETFGSEHLLRVLEGSDADNTITPLQSPTTGKPKDASFPPLPTAELAGENLWPAGAGADALAQLQQLQPLTRELSDGQYLVDFQQHWAMKGLRMQSKAEADKQLQRLVARHTEAPQELLHAERCLTIIPWHQEWVLWEIVKTKRSVYHVLSQSIEKITPERCARSLVAAFLCLLRGNTLYDKHFGIRAALQEISIADQGAVFQGFLLDSLLDSGLSEAEATRRSLMFLQEMAGDKKTAISAELGRLQEQLPRQADTIQMLVRELAVV